MKSVLGKSPNSRINAKDLYAETRNHYTGLESFDEHDLKAFLSCRDESGNQRRNHAGMVLADRRLIKFGAHG